MKFIELIWLCKQKEKARSSQASISKNSCTELRKTLLFPEIKVKNYFSFLHCFGIVIFRLGGKKCVVKNEKWIEFSESPYVNLNPVFDKLQKQVCRTVGPSPDVSLESLAYCHNIISLSLFYRYYFGRCSLELVELAPLPCSRGRSTHYSISSILCCHSYML